MEQIKCKTCLITYPTTEFYWVSKRQEFTVNCKFCIKDMRNSPKFKKEDKSITCLGCNREFNDTDVIFCAKNLCRRCYNTTNLRFDQGAISNSCVDCGKDIKRSRVYVRRIYSDKCKSCYEKWYRLNLKTICSECGVGITPTISGICKPCKKDIKDKTVVEKNKEFVPTETKTIYIDDTTINKIKLILLRYKHGFNERIDDFILIDTYLTIFGYQQDLDGLIKEAQLISMLKQLKGLYEHKK